MGYEDIWSDDDDIILGRVLCLWRLLHMLRHFDPPFAGLWKICIVSTPIFGAKMRKISTHIFSCDQAALKNTYMLYFCPSVCPSVDLSVRLSVCHTNDRSDVHAKCQGHNSKFKVTEVITQFSRFRTVTPVWIHQWLRNDAQSLKWHIRGALLFFKAIRQIPRSHGTTNRWFWPQLSVSGL